MNQQLEQASDKLKRTEEMLRQATKDAILGKTLGDMRWERDQSDVSGS